MAVKLRLARHGAKRDPFYRIVASDSRSPRDGRFIEIIGYYDPTRQPAEVKIDEEKALKWLSEGAQPSDTVRSILSRQGVYMKKHLLGGVAKGAFDEATAEAKFEEWLKNKQSGLETIQKAEKEEAAKTEAQTTAQE